MTTLELIERYTESLNLDDIEVIKDVAKRLERKQRTIDEIHGKFYDATAEIVSLKEICRAEERHRDNLWNQITIMQSALQEARDHLYTKQDMERVRQLSEEALRKVDNLSGSSHANS